MAKNPNAPDIGDFQLERVKLEIVITAEVVFPLGTDAQTMIQWALDRVSMTTSIASCVKKVHVRPFPIGVVSS